MSFPLPRGKLFPQKPGVPCGKISPQKPGVPLPMPMRPTDFQPHQIMGVHPQQQGSPSGQIRAAKARLRQAEARLLKSKKDMMEVWKTHSMDLRDVRELKEHLQKLESST